MKRLRNYLLIICTLLLTFSCNKNEILKDETQKQIMTQLLPGQGEQAGLKLDPGESVSFAADFEDKDYPVRRILRVVGKTELPGRFAARGETLFRASEYLIDDHLDSIHTNKDKYSLFFEGNNNTFEQYAYYRISRSQLNAGDLRLEVEVKREDMITRNGEFGVEMEVYLMKPDRHPDEIYYTPDTLLYMPIPEGTGDFTLLSQDFVLPDNVANVLLRVGGKNFSGRCWLEAPRISQSGKKPIVIPFVPHDFRPDDYNYWVGVNLSSRSWPTWKLETANQVIIEEPIFDRASNIADFYIHLPNDLKSGEELKLTLLKNNYKASFPYEVSRIQLLEEPARDFEIVTVPKYPAVGDTVGILLEINRPDITLKFQSNKYIEFLRGSKMFDKTGLFVAEIVVKNASMNIPVAISNGKEKRNAIIQQSIIKEKDGVYLSSGDEIHIDNKIDIYEDFFKWYFRERVGNWYHFRPSYQWSGVRDTGEEFVSYFSGLLNQMRVPYAWQVEGRTLAGSRINPSLESLSSHMFRGKQAHENDGGYYYWRHFLYEGLYSDLAARARPYGGIFAKHPPIYTDYGIFIHYDPYAVKDMADGAGKYVENLAYSRGESTRHTGPSTTFRYLYQAGYEWLGAEQMYGPEETVLSALRGASRVYGKKEYGSLHAVQWGSYPFTDPKHSLRFYLSLAVSYMHGVSHINTEEGLWTDEYANDRFTEAGKQHMYAQHQVLDFMETHSRRGEIKNKIAVLQGRNDPWKSYGRGPLWSQNDKKWEFNDATKSFDLLKVFYPENNIANSGPDGWFTSTPYGPVDILPIEATQDIMDTYKAILFLGWNSYNEDDFRRLTHFVEKGGTLLLTAAQINTELQPDLAPRFPDNDQVIRQLLGDNYQTLAEVTMRDIGKGKVIYFPEKFYPIHSTIQDQYVEKMKDIASEIVNEEKEKGWINATPHIEFTVWDASDRRTIYVLNNDWKNEEVRTATVSLNNKEYKVEIPLYSIATVHCFDDLALFTNNNTTDVLSCKKENKKWIVQIQTTGPDSIKVMNTNIDN
ncbi:MAG: hypothetical protein LIO93_04980, partial [Bacteroidales bacterium]|nr:hypothetical protein [Bacteroidales bacterium]